MSSPENAGSVAPSPPPTLEELIPQRKVTESVLRCIGCMLGRAEDGTIINAPDIIACTKLERAPVHHVLRDIKGASILEPFTPDVPTAPPMGNRKPGFTTYLRPTELGATLLSPNLQPDCPSSKSKPIRSIMSAQYSEEVLDLTKRATDVIIDDLPSQTFENGIQLLNHLNSTYYGDTTQLNMVIKALTRAGKKKLPDNRHVQIDDIVQDVLLEIGKREKEITFPKEMPLLYAVTYRRIIDYQRTLSTKNRQTYSLEIFDGSQADASVTPSVEDEVVSRISFQDTFSELAADMKLSPVQIALLETIMSGAGEDGVITELARRFDKTKSHIRVIKTRLLGQLRERLDSAQ